MSNASTAWSFFTGKGYSPSATAGILGNFQEESGIDPTSHEGGGGPGRGIAQWTVNQRWQNLLHYASQTGSDPYNLNTQLNFAYNEMQGMGLSPSGMNSMDVDTATQVFEKRFEAAGIPHMDVRLQDAHNIYNEFVNGAPAIQGTGGYGSNTIPGLTQTSAGSSSQPASAFPTGKDANNDIIAMIDKSLKIESFDIWHPVNSVMQDAGAIAMRTVLVILGLILLIFGLVAVVEKSGVTPPVPIPV